MATYELKAGAVLSRSFAIWARNIVPFTILSLLVFVPSFAFEYLGLNDGRRFGMTPTMFSLIDSGIRMVLGLVTTSAITYGVVQQLRGRPAPIGASVSFGLTRIVSVLGTSLLVGLCIVVSMVFLIIPGLIVTCMLHVAVPVAVLEKVGAFQSLSRSAELTAGNKSTIFGIVFLLGIMIIALVLLFQLTLGRTSVIAFVAGQAGISAVVGALSSTASAVIYHDLRQGKEGIDIEQLAAVFE
jgi:hypothetical protein